MNFNVTSDEGKNKILLEINEDKNRLDTTSGIDIALEQAKLDIRLLDETIESVKTIKQNCDKIDMPWLPVLEHCAVYWICSLLENPEKLL